MVFAYRSSFVGVERKQDVVRGETEFDGGVLYHDLENSCLSEIYAAGSPNGLEAS